MIRKMKNRYQANSRRDSGFTMPEIILIISVLAIISGMAFPDIALFFRRQQVEQEKISMSEIQKAMDSYARECKRLPARTNNPTRANCTDAPGAAGIGWHEALASFSSMAPDSILNDVIGTERKYTHFVESRNYREGAVDFHYATVRSVGGNQCDDTGTTATPASPACVSGGVQANAANKAANISNFRDRAGITGTYQADWANVDQYGAYQLLGDDILVKYADNQQKIDNQDETIHRLERIIDALDRYAQGRLNEDLLLGTACLSELIFYPPSWSTEPRAHSNSNHPDVGCRSLGSNITNRYSGRVRADVSAIRGDTNEFVDTINATTATRMAEMRTLMRILGLPEDHCCNAVTGEPFYYYSHPGAVIGASCTYSLQPPYYPAKVAISPITCGN